MWCSGVLLMTSFVVLRLMSMGLQHGMDVDVCDMRLWLINGVQLLRGPCP